MIRTITVEGIAALGFQAARERVAGDRARLRNELPASSVRKLAQRMIPKERRLLAKLPRNAMRQAIKRHLCELEAKPA